jgi:hypothetical protein
MAAERKRMREREKESIIIKGGSEKEAENFAFPACSRPLLAHPHQDRTRADKRLGK